MQATAISFIIPALALLLAGAFYWLWRKYPSNQRFLGFAVGNLFASLGFVLILLGVTVFDSQNLFVLSVVFNLAALSFCAAKLQHFHVEFPTKTFVGVAAVGCACVGLTQLLGGTEVNQLFVANSTIGLLFAFSALLAGQKPIVTLSDKVLMTIMIIVAAQSFVRPAFDFMIDGALFPEASTDPIFHIAVGGLLAIMGLILLFAVAYAQYEEDLVLAKRDASIDSLSGLSSRKLFEESVNDLLLNRRTQKQKTALIICDIDHFKRINDKCGHQTGDKAITSVGALIQSSTRPSDVLGRIGGEEFCIFLTNIEVEVAVRLADRIRRSVTSISIEGLDDDDNLTASFGVAAMLEGENYEQLFRRADTALYRAKDLGRNRVELCEKNNPNVVHQMIGKLTAV